MLVAILVTYFWVISLYLALGGSTTQATPKTNMAASSRKLFVPPSMNDDFEAWLREIDIWRCVTDLDKQKQGPAIYLSLDQKTRNGCADIDVKELNSDGGVDVLLTKLRTLYARDVNQMAFLAYEKFEKFSRPKLMSVGDYINEFERLYYKIKICKMELPDGVLAYRVLKSSNISPEKEQLARATITELTYDKMKKQLKSIFDYCSDNEGVKRDDDIKVEEEVYFNRNTEVEGGARPKWRNNQRGSHNQRGAPSEYVSRGGRRTNPVDSYGNTSACAICNSIFHWARNCPDSHERQRSVENIVLFTREIQDCYISRVFGETLNLGILDCGSTQNVCGKVWLDCFLSTLTPQDQLAVQEKISNVYFRFGTGPPLKAIKQVTIPVHVAEKLLNLTCEVVDCDLPLLLSKDWMKSTGTKIDFANDSANIFGKDLNLQYTESGHYAIPLTQDKTVFLSECSLLEMSKVQKQQLVVKLHKQFGHPSGDKLVKLVQESGIGNRELFDLIRNYENICKVCVRYRKPALRPVGLSLAKEFNETVSMDSENTILEDLCEPDQITEQLSVTENVETNNIPTVIGESSQSFSNSNSFPNRGSKILFRDDSKSEWSEAVVISRAGEATGKNKQWVNIKDNDGTLKSLNLENLDWKTAEEVLISRVNFKAENELISVTEAKLKEIENWKDHCVYSEVDDRDVFLRPPREAGTTKLWKLKTTVYGLCDAPQVWYLRIKEELIQYGATMSSYDEAVFFWRSENKLQGIICCHVDDFCWGGTNIFQAKVIDVIRSKFKISTEDHEIFRYVGLDLKQANNEIQMSQLDEIDFLDISLNGCSKYDSITESELKSLRGIAVQLNWTANQTRPDIAFHACETSVSQKNGVIEDLMKANKSIRKLKSEKVHLTFQCLGDIDKLCLFAFSDASLANLKNGGSQGGYVVFLLGANGKSALLTWQSKKIGRVVKSTIAAETLALLELAEACCLLRITLCEILNISLKRVPIHCVVDNKSLCETVHSTKTLVDKRLKIDVCVLRDMLSRSEIQNVDWTESSNQLAESLTKAGAPSSKLINALSGQNLLCKYCIK